MLAMFHTRQDLALGRAVALQFVRDDHPWHVGQALEQLLEEFLGGVLVPPTLHQYSQNVAVLIHGPPQIVTLAVNGEKDLIKMPCVAWLRTTAPEPIRIRLAEFATPLPDRFVGDDDPSGEQQLLDI